MADDGSREGPSGDRSSDLRGRDLIGLGGLLAGCVVAGTALGYVLDQAAGTSPAFTLVGIALGMVAGAVGFWAKVRSALRDPGSS
jgi:F0F1-type ATP synthase assembly protein I